ncbi:MAG: 16S rRNA methyltransferase [Armatimonadota bacterium]|nr:16S rRNA methyltransferase [Armatimonadota bacterium]
MVDQIVAELAQSRRYAFVCPETLRRVATWAAQRYPPRHAAAAARRKLHQVYGAFLAPRAAARVAREVEALPPNPPTGVLEETCRRVLALHASTAERLPLLEGLYPDLFASHPPCRVLDLACGLHPFAIPWMGLGKEVCYLAYDIDTRLTTAINTFFAHLGIAGQAVSGDLLVSLPNHPADLVFLLKTLPCLEQQEKGAALRLLSALRAPRIVVSFPARTLGGRDVGMREHYAAFMADLAHALGACTHEVSRPNETFYVLQR